MTNSSHTTTQLADRLLSIYSLILILLGTPCNFLCCLIYFQKSNRKNSIKIIFGYLAILDTIVLYTFNLNYVVREFNIDYQFTYVNLNNQTKKNVESLTQISINFIIIKKNLEEYSLVICRLLSYIAFSTLQTASWILTFGSFNRYLLVSQHRSFKFICKRTYTLIICSIITCIFFLANIHLLWLNGYQSKYGNIICYQNQYSSQYFSWYQRIHLCLYSVCPSIILFILNTLLMRKVFASKKRLDSHKQDVLLSLSSLSEPATTPNERRKSMFSKRFSQLSSLRFFQRSNNPRTTLNRHSRKLTLSLIFITMSFFILTFPSTVIFSFFRPYIEPLRLRRTLSLFFTNLSTTTHVIRFFIYFVCSIDFRNDFYQLFSFKTHVRSKTLPSK